MGIDEAEKIIGFLESHHFSLVWWNYLLVGFLAILGGYVGSYLRKKGELKAISEDFESILAQVKKQAEETENIKIQFEKQFSAFESELNWSEKVVSELLGPLYIQFERTKRASDRWDKENLFIEASVIKEGNTTIRDLLLTKGQLILSNLLDDAGKLIDHYDKWLEEFDRVKARRASGENVSFVFTYDFPRKSEKAFKEALKDIRKTLSKKG